MDVLVEFNGTSPRCREDLLSLLQNITAMRKGSPFVEASDGLLTSQQTHDTYELLGSSSTMFWWGAYACKFRHQLQK
jgi:hypothetical protein